MRDMKIIAFAGSNSSKSINKKLATYVTSFFKTLKNHAEQLTAEQRWYRILSKAVEKYLHGTLLRPTNCLPMPAS